MSRNFYIRVPPDLAYRLDREGVRRTENNRITNAWYLEAITETAKNLELRLSVLAELGCAATDLKKHIAELEWLWRGITLVAPTHPDDADLCLEINASHEHTKTRLTLSADQLRTIRERLAILLQTDSFQLLPLRSRASQAAEAIFARSAHTDPMDLPIKIALLAMACDAIDLAPGEQLGPILTAAYKKHLVAPGLVAASQARPSGKKKLAANSVKINLELPREDFERVEEIRSLLELNRNAFAREAIRSIQFDHDPAIAIARETLRKVILAVDSLIHSALSCVVAASHALDTAAKNDFAKEVQMQAWTVYLNGLNTLQLLNGAAVHFVPEFVEAILPLIDEVNREVASAQRSQLLTPETLAIKDYLTVLRILA